MAISKPTPDVISLLICDQIITDRATGKQSLIGLLGFAFHLGANLQGPSASLWDNLIFGAPVFAPLLFSNLAVLAAIGLWELCARAMEYPPQAPARVERRCGWR